MTESNYVIEGKIIPRRYCGKPAIVSNEDLRIEAEKEAQDFYNDIYGELMEN